MTATTDSLKDSLMLSAQTYGTDTNHTSGMLTAFSLSKGDKKHDDESNNIYLNMKELGTLALAGNINAQAQLGRNYLHGRQTRKNGQEASKWLSSAAKHNDTPAGRWAQGLCYEGGIGTTKNEKAAFECYQAAAKENYLPAILSVAMCLEHGIGVPQNENHALKLYTQCADLGNALAQAHVARCHLDCIGVNLKNMDIVIKYANLSAVKGDSLGQAMLARCYENGDGVKQDPKLAMKFYKLSSEQGDTFALYKVAYYFFHEWDEHDRKIGIELFRASAEQGNADAQLELGKCYCYGSALGTESFLSKDIKQGKYWFGLSAAQGNKSAQGELEHVSSTCYGCTIL